MFDLIISERATNLQVTRNAIIENKAIGCFDPCLLIRAIRVMLLVKLHPAAVLMDFGRYWVSDISDRQAAIEDKG